MFEEILRYSPKQRFRNRARRAYIRWRAAQRPPLPDRWFNSTCHFHTAALPWGKTAACLNNVVGRDSFERAVLGVARRRARDDWPKRSRALHRNLSA